ncbi:upper zone of growth plate and cartilage matrix associated a isoform X2 [Ictalurus punctatus]|uniref:Unique cartilage matrix-associated protein n=1 Tax=Ictalurus punctatus TaxID=7998 RepID=A0A9F7TQG8_ICTPU|nr:upper zone of growth plate and cartilage matrix associated a isoform X2 [Ictalurus punctatus]
MARLHVALLALLPIVLILTVLSEVESAAVKNGKEKANERHAEHKLQSAASERRREYYEEQSNEYENHLEESRNEQYERNRENAEQWREYHYDGLYPQYPHHRPYV